MVIVGTLTFARDGAVMADGAADAGADQPMMTDKMPGDTADHRATHAAGLSGLDRASAGQCQNSRNKHHRFFHASILRMAALSASPSGNGIASGEVHHPPVACYAISPFSFVTAAPGAVSTGQRTAALTAAAARDVEKCASSTAS